MRTQFVAPIGRDYVAWSSAGAQKEWLQAVGTPSRQFQQRMMLMINDIRQRGFVVERLTHQYQCVYAALRMPSNNASPATQTCPLSEPGRRYWMGGIVGIRGMRGICGIVGT